MCRLSKLFRLAVAALVISPIFTSSVYAGDNGVFRIDRARWDENRLEVRGDGGRNQTVTVTYLDGTFIGDDQVDGGEWRVRVSNISPVPCNVRATQSDGQTAVRAVRDAPADCSDGDGPPPGGGGEDFPTQTDFKILMNYELGMHCTGFEFAYCCVLPVYNSILAQVVKPEGTGGADFPELLAGDPNNGLDGLGRQTVLRDRALDSTGNFKKYVIKYWHEAQPRAPGSGKEQLSRVISAVEGNSLMAWNTVFDSAAVNPDGTLVIEDYNGSTGVMVGDGDTLDPTDNYQNAIWNHLYFYEDLEGTNSTGTSRDDDKIRLGVSGQTNPEGLPDDIAFPEDCGPAFHPMGPDTSNGQPIGPDPDHPALVANDCGGFSNGNVLTFSGEHGTIVYTQMKVLENLPIMLTSPDIWEALGLPLTPFEDTIDFFGDPGLVDEDSVRPFVAMKAQMHNFDPNVPGGAGDATLDSAGQPVIGFGTAPIDIPNCERCHSNGPDGTFVTIPPSESDGTDDDPGQPGDQLKVVNSPNPAGSEEWLNTQLEYNFWNAYYDIDKAAGDSDWYSRLKSAALSMLTAHDIQHGTSFTANYPQTECIDDTDCVGGPLTNESDIPQNTRLGHESVICQRCHADNVIAVVKSASCGAGIGDEVGEELCAEGTVIKPITEAVHNNHRGESVGGPIVFSDLAGRDGGCQGCHPAHRSDGSMDGYPITLAGGNRYALADNRDANGGCFVGRDVHSNPGKDVDGAETDEHLNAAGAWLAQNVYHNQGELENETKGIWCTNCHNQLGQELWKAENMEDLVNGVGISNPRAAGQGAADVEDGLNQLAAAVNTSLAQAKSWLDPKAGNGQDDTWAIWDPDPGLCNYVADYVGGTGIDPAQDGTVATVEVSIGGGTCSNVGDGDAFQVPVDCGFVAFDICGSVDVDGDFSVNLVAGMIAGEEQSPFCTTPDCVAAAQATLNSDCGPGAGDRCAVPVPFSAATDGRDHWLSAGEPHCADCHSAPYVEQSGNINAFPPFNYPRKASLMRYSRGHQDISCQGCHESIHGLYPVTPTTDTTSYAQAASLNHDGTHGPLKCGTCHETGGGQVPLWVDEMRYNGQRVAGNFEAAVTWMHTYTAEADPLQDVCLNCHGDEANEVSWREEKWTEHTMEGRTARQTMDRVEELLGIVDPDNLDINRALNTLCESCHSDERNDVQCDREWKLHLTEGRVSDAVWTGVSEQLLDGDTCGW